MNYQNKPLAAIPSYLDQSFRHELRELDAFDQDCFALMATATASALSEGRTSVVSSNRAAIICSCRRLAMRLGARIELVERGELTDVIFSPAVTP
jgi:hypothetical protein